MDLEILLDRIDFMYHKALKDGDAYTSDALWEVICILTEKISE